MTDPGIKIEITDLKTGDTETKVVTDDVIVIAVGRHYVDGVQKYPGTGTQVWTIKVNQA